MTLTDASDPTALPPENQNPGDPDISGIIADERIFTLYQPLVSIRKKSLVGCEALSRGVPLSGEEPIPPQTLFSLAEEQGLSLELDRLCRETAFAGFAPLHRRDPDLVLFFNLETSLLEQDLASTQHLLKQVRKYSINPNNVVIELLESRVRDTDALMSFTHRYRELGFLICLDDLGSGHSNLERVARIKPDVIKIDRSLISGVNKEFHKQEVTRALSNLGRRLGALVVGEGVETADEALTLLELGVDVFQGFHFSKPQPLSDREKHYSIQVQNVADRFRLHVVSRLTLRKHLFSAYDDILRRLLIVMEGTEPGRMGEAMADFIQQNQDVECLYVLNKRGIQVTDTVCNTCVIRQARRFIYHPAEKGADHSLKSYYMPIVAGLTRFTTPSYISLASGNLCTTISSLFTAPNGKEYILCMDVAQENGSGSGLNSLEAPSAT